MASSGTKLIAFDVETLLKLMTHYSDGATPPLDAELESIGVSRYLQRCIALNYKTHEAGPEIEQFRYSGKKIMNWTQGSEPEWVDGNDTPKLM